MRSRDVERTGGRDGCGPGGPERAGRLDDASAGRPMDDLVLRTPPNWTAVGFFGLLGVMHLVLATLAFAGARWEGYLSLMLGAVFVAASAVAVAFRFEVAVLPSARRVRLRHGVGRLCVEQVVPFSDVRGVRLTFAGAPEVAAGVAPAAPPAPGAEGGEVAGASTRKDDRRRRTPEARIELLCPYDAIECPQTPIPRQEALYLAMALNVPLIKVSAGTVPGEPAGPQEPRAREPWAEGVSSRRDRFG